MSEEKAAADGGAGGKPVEEVPDPELDNLLDDALQDFTRPQVPKPATTTTSATPDLAAAMAALGVNATVSGGQGGGSSTGGAMWTEEFIQQATAQFEQTMRALMEQQQGMQQKPAPAPTATTTTTTAVTGSSSTTTPVSEGEGGGGGGGGDEGGVEGAVDLSSLSAQFAQFAEAAGRAATEAQSDADFTRCLADTLAQLGQNNEQLQNPPTAEDLGKMFEGLGLSGGGSGGEEGALGGLFPLMQVMLENILSKDVLYAPMKEITDKYPDWLADHRSSLPEEEYQRYNSQYHVMSQVVELYEGETETDSEEVKGQRFEKIMLSMQKLQELGQPPKDLVGDLGPIINFDAAGNPILPDLAALTGGGGGGPANEGGGGETGEQCVVM